jgi:hypothetical protein
MTVDGTVDSSDVLLDDSEDDENSGVCRLAIIFKIKISLENDSCPQRK